MNIAMWGKAFYRMPRLTAEEWKGLDFVSRLLVAIRAASLIMTMQACLLAGALAARDGKLDVKLWLFVTVGLLMAHATNNLLNDLTDHWKGTDSNAYFRSQYGVHVLEQGVMTARQLGKWAAGVGAVALAAGGYLLWVRAGLVLHLFAAGIFFVLFYTYPLKYYGLGEFAVLAVWGPLMVGGGYYVIAGEWSWSAALVGCVYALGPTQLIFGKHIDKYSADTRKKIRTLPVVLGESGSRKAVIAMLVVQYLLLGAVVAAGFVSPFALVALLSLGTFFKCVKVYRSPRPTERPTDFFADVWPLWFAAWSFLHSARFGLFLLIGVALELAWGLYTGAPGVTESWRRALGR